MEAEINSETKKCPACNGRGLLIFKDGRKEKCSKCRGTGTISKMLILTRKEMEKQQKTCAACHGTGRIKFIVRGLINGEWKTLAIVSSYSIAEARLKALNVFADPLIVMDLTFWMHSDDVVKRNVEEIALAAYKRKKEEAKGD